MLYREHDKISGSCSSSLHKSRRHIFEINTMVVVHRGNLRVPMGLERIVQLSKVSQLLSKASITADYRLSKRATAYMYVYGSM